MLSFKKATIIIQGKANEAFSYFKRAATDDNDLIPPGLGNHDQKQMNKFLNVILCSKEYSIL
mgnify:CR=1 FL=1